MGRSYWFECSKCGYRAKVSGRADRGLNFSVQTIACQDCRELYDAVTQMRIPDEAQGSFLGNHWRLRQLRFAARHPMPKQPPSFQSALNRLQYTGVRRSKWMQFKLQCPVSPQHRVQSWNEPNKCPRCGVHLEKSSLPYRIWD